MRIILIFASLFSAGACPAESPKESWLRWKMDQEKHFRETNMNNPFSLQDVMELPPNHTAYLSIREKPVRPRWQREKPSGSFAEFRFDGKSLLMKSNSIVSENFGSWKMRSQISIHASGIRQGSVWLYLYYVKENQFRPSLIPFFPFNGKAVVRAKLDRSKANDHPIMKDTMGGDRNYKIIGEAEFSYAGKSQRLQVYVTNPKKPLELFIPFKDLTSGNSTYGGGRFIEAELDTPEANELTIDFNRAYNPYCLYSHFFSCPVVAGNKLEIAMKAGAKLPPVKH